MKALTFKEKQDVLEDLFKKYHRAVLQLKCLEERNFYPTIQFDTVKEKKTYYQDKGSQLNDQLVLKEELEKVINPFYDNYHEYIINYVMPEVIAFYIASSFSRNAMWEATFYQHYNSAKDTFNISDDEDYDSIKAEVIKLLRMKYSLEIISENPLDFKKIEY